MEKQIALNTLIEKFNQLNEENRYILLAEAVDLLSAQRLRDKHIVSDNEEAEIIKIFYDESR